MRCTPGLSEQTLILPTEQVRPHRPPKNQRISCTSSHPRLGRTGSHQKACSPPRPDDLQCAHLPVFPLLPPLLTWVHSSRYRLRLSVYHPFLHDHLREWISFPEAVSLCNVSRLVRTKRSPRYPSVDFEFPSTRTRPCAYCKRSCGCVHHSNQNGHVRNQELRTQFVRPKANFVNFFHSVLLDKSLAKCRMDVRKVMYNWYRNLLPPEVLTLSLVREALLLVFQKLVEEGKTVLLPCPPPCFPVKVPASKCRLDKTK